MNHLLQFIVSKTFLKIIYGRLIFEVYMNNWFLKDKSVKIITAK